MKYVFLLCLISSQCFAGIYITVSGATVKRAKMALGHLHPLPDAVATDAGLAKNVRDQIKADLEFANLFDFINDGAVTPFDGAKDLYAIRYEDWTPLGASFLLKLGYKVSQGKLVLEALMYDIPGKKKIFGTRYQYPAAQYVRLVHALAEDVLKELTGERGLFFSRIAMSCRDKRVKLSPPKDIYVSDPDGRNMVAITSDKTLSLSPGWAPDGKTLTYTQYEWRTIRGTTRKNPVIKRHDLQTGQRVVLSAKEGMNSGASWSPKGDRIAATLSFTGRPELYLLNPSNPGDPEPLSRNIQWKRIGSDSFQGSAVSLLFDVEPSWAPDAKRIVFSSARTGHPMIYIVDLTTKVATQLTFAGVYNASPSWSPKNDKIIFAAQRTGEGNFDLYLIDPDGNNLTRITNGERIVGRRVNSENPSWAPTGRHIVYASSEGGFYAIYVMTIDGTFRRKISPPDKECFTPSWGPFEG